MPSKKVMEQCLSWLRSQAASKNTLDSINADICINVIEEYQKREDKLKAIIGNMKRTLDKKVSNDILEDKSKQLTFEDLGVL